jgi:uncharacterized glyoxalase superfamily metalloenzyme YdcJ
MAREKQLRKKQLAVINDLFDGGMDEQAVLDKHHISRNVYNKWLANELFVEKFSRRMEWAYKQSEALIMKYAAVAAAKLVQLTESDNPETARKACLDIISLPKTETQKKEQSAGAKKGNGKEAEQLSPERAGRLLAALAESGEK